jgi:two-component system, NarL family, sensor histidine kinase BarA
VEDQKKLLIVEDDDLTLKFFQIYLGKYFEITCCKSAEEFYAKIDKQQYDLLIMDLSLRGSKDGLVLTRELRQMKNYENTPVFAVTANALKRDEDAAYKAGVSRFLRKPIDNKVLLEEIKSALNINS